MRVHFAQSGGLAGLVRECTLDTASLDATAAARLEKLVQESGLAAARPARSRRGRDLRSYEVTIEDGGKTLRVALDDHSVPEPARPLIAHLRRLAGPASRQGSGVPIDER